jgi:hypothetical protein
MDAGNEDGTKIQMNHGETMKKKSEYGRITLPKGTTHNERAKSRVEFKPGLVPSLGAIPWKEGDQQDEVLDGILNNALEALFPYLTKENAGVLTHAAIQHFQTHLSTELCIVNGDLEEEVTSPVVIRLQKQFGQRRK